MSILVINMIKPKIALFLILSLLLSILSVAITSEQLLTSFGEEADDAKSKETKSEIKFDSKPKDDTKTKEYDVKSKYKDKLKEDISTTTTTTTTTDNPETIDRTIFQ